MTDAVLDQAMLAALERNEGQSELVDGEVVPVSPAGFAHARTVMQIGRLLADFAERTDCGVVIAGDPGFIWDERNVRAPDLAVVSKVDAKKAPQKGFMPFAPLLAVWSLSKLLPAYWLNFCRVPDDDWIGRHVQRDHAREHRSGGL
jgi:Uma2 family endonuclease